MKHLIFFLLLAPIVLFGQSQEQTKEIKTDTLYLEWDIIPDVWPGEEDSIFYEVREITFTDGYQETQRNPLGDTSVVIAYFRNRSIDLARQYTNNAVVVIRQGQVTKAIQNTNDALFGTLGVSVFDEVDTLFSAELLGNYMVTENGVDYAATLTRAGNGNLRLSWNAANRSLTLFSDTMIRIRAYPAPGSNIEVFRVAPGRYVSIDRTLIVRKL